jgi:hypothetical protein
MIAESNARERLRLDEQRHADPHAPTVSGRWIVLVGGVLFSAVVLLWYFAGERIAPIIDGARAKERELGRKFGPEDAPKRKSAP